MKHKTKTTTTKITMTKVTTPLRDQCLSHCATLGIPLAPAALDELLSRAEKEGLPHLQFLDLLLGAEAHARRERGGGAPHSRSALCGGESSGGIRLAVQSRGLRPRADRRASHGRFYPAPRQPDPSRLE